MDVAPLLWIGGILVSALVALIGLVYKTLDREIQSLRDWRHGPYNSDYAKLQLEDRAIEGKFNDLPARTKHCEEFIEELRDWKHETIDPYIPRAVDDLERRITRLESK